MTLSDQRKAHIADNLAEHILRSGIKDKTACLITAITTLYGSMELFYEDFYKLLDAKDIKDFGTLVDQAVERKKKSRSDFASIICSEAFKKIIKNLMKIRTGVAQDADHAIPISPSTATPITYKPGKSEKER